MGGVCFWEVSISGGKTVIIIITINYNVILLLLGTPKDIKYNNVKVALESIEGVVAAHSLHIWSLTVNKAALAVHLAIGVCMLLAVYLKGTVSWCINSKLL